MPEHIRSGPDREPLTNGHGVPDTVAPIRQANRFPDGVVITSAVRSNWWAISRVGETYPMSSRSLHIR